MYFLGKPIGWLMGLIYSFVGNYGLTLIIISVIIKLITLPLTIKQQKSTTAQQQLQPLINEINQKYKNDKEKQSQEVMKLYKEYKINPLAGCLPLLIQFPIILGLYAAVARPLSFMMGLTEDQLSSICNLVGIEFTKNFYSIELPLAKAIAGNLEAVKAMIPNVFAVNFNFLGLDISETPKFATLTAAWIFPIGAAIMTFVGSFVTQPKTDPNAPKNELASTTKTMMYFFPVMILYIGFQVPSGVSLYWIINSVLQVIQFYALDKKTKLKLADKIADTEAIKDAKKVKSKKRR